MFYGGIAVGVVLIAPSSAGTPATLTGYLFGAITTTTANDLMVFAVLAAVVLVHVPDAGAAALRGGQRRGVRPRQRTAGDRAERAAGRAHGRHRRGVDARRRAAADQRPDDPAERPWRSSSPAASARPLRWADAGRRRRQRGRGRRSRSTPRPPRAARSSCSPIAAFVAGERWSAGCAAGLRARRTPAPSEHPHEHGPDCGHPAVAHDDHVDYLHDGHRHAAHGAHYDEHGRAPHAEVEPPHGHDQPAAPDEAALRRARRSSPSRRVPHRAGDPRRPARAGNRIGLATVYRDAAGHGRGRRDRRICAPTTARRSTGAAAPTTTTTSSAASCGRDGRGGGQAVERWAEAGGRQRARLRRRRAHGRGVRHLRHDCSSGDRA